MEIQPHEDYQKLRSEIEALSNEYSILWEEKEQLETQKIPYLKSIYNTNISPIELEYMNAYLELFKIRRKIELIQEKLNRGENVSIEDIDLNIKEELKDWLNDVQKLEQAVFEAKMNMVFSIPQDEYNQIKKIYRNLVRSLHPDLNGLQTEQEKLLWQRLQEAYKNLDLHELKTLEQMVGTNRRIEAEDELTSLKKRKKAIEKQLFHLQEHITKLKNSFPLNIAEKIENENWQNSRIEDLIAQKNNITKALKQYMEIYHELLFQIYGNIEGHPENYE